MDSDRLGASIRKDYHDFEVALSHTYIPVRTAFVRVFFLILKIFFGRSQRFKIVNGICEKVFSRQLYEFHQLSALLFLVLFRQLQA